MTWIGTILRTIFILCDMYVFYLVRYVYQLLFTIATFDFLDRQMIFHMFSRVQLILGVFMVFQLTMTIIKGIVNPDSFTDSKTGAGNIIMRIIVSLALLGLIVPLNIPSPKNDYEKQINNNGILFGTLYSLQNRILINNTLGKLILGDDTTNYEDSYGEDESIMKIGDTFLSVVVKTFYQLNVDEDGNYVCDDGWDDTYNDENTTPIEIIANGWVPCGGAEGAFGDLAGNMRISYTYFLTTLVGIVLAVLLFMITFNVAKRVFQLAALQLMAPIPIISYMDPKGSKDGAFNSWLKLLGKTYLELFIQLAVIYFAIGMINSFILRFPDLLLQSGENAFSDPFSGTIEVLSLTTSVASPLGPGLIKWTFIIVVISLFVFAKDAPKFFKQMLGIKDDGAGFFSAFGTAMGFGIAAAGAIGSFNASRRANYDADETNAKIAKRRSLIAGGMSAEAADEWVKTQGNQYAAAHAHGGLNRAKNVLAGLFGAGSGLVTGAAAASESKGNAWAKMMAATNAMNKRNRNVRNAGDDGVGFISAIGTKGEEIFTGQNEWDRMKAENDAAKEQLKYREDKLKYENEVNSMLLAIKQEAAAKAPKSLLTTGTITADPIKKPQLVAYAGLKANGSDFNSWVADIQSGNGVKNWYVNATGDVIDQEIYDTLNDQQKAFFTVDGTYGVFEDQNHQIWKIDTNDIVNIKNEIDDLNEADFAEAVIEGRAGFDNTVISASAERFEHLTGKNINEFASLKKDGTHTTDANGNHVFSYSNMKRLMGDEDARIKEGMAKVQQEKQAVADKENSLEAKRAKASSGYFDNNGGNR